MAGACSDQEAGEKKSWDAERKRFYTNTGKD